MEQARRTQTPEFRAINQREQTDPSQDKPRVLARWSMTVRGSRTKTSGINPRLGQPNQPNSSNSKKPPVQPGSKPWRPNELHRSNPLVSKYVISYELDIYVCAGGLTRLVNHG